MMHRARYLILLAVAFGCTRTKTISDSDPRYLTEGDYQCYEPSAARISEVDALLPKGFISEKFGQQKQMVLNRLAGIPNPYLLHLVERFKKGEFSGVAPASLGGGVAGVTELSGPSNDELYAISIVVGMNQVAFALQHEVGHAVETFVKLESRKKGVNFESGFQSIYQEAQSTPRVRSYAKSANYESWAEAFANYYCSQESKAFIDGGSGGSGMPQTSKFLASVLLPPLWLQSGGSDPNVPATNEIFVYLDTSKSSDQSSAIANFAVSNDASYVEFCPNLPANDCKPESAGYQRVNNGANKMGRLLFSASTEIALIDGSTLGVVSRKSSGELINSKSLQITRR